VRATLHHPHLAIIAELPHPLPELLGIADIPQVQKADLQHDQNQQLISK